MTVITRSEGETENLGFQLAGRLTPGTVLAFFGDLGTGKTTFARGLARGLGVEDQVTSPTYTIVNEYRGPAGEFIHFDMYRLGTAEELFEIGWEDYLARGAILAVEWSEKVEEALFPDAVRVYMEKRGDGEREIRITGLEEKEGAPCGY